MRFGRPYLWQDELRRPNPIMVLTMTLNKTLPRGTRPAIPDSGTDSVQALRPTFEGWGPRL